MNGAKTSRILKSTLALFVLMTFRLLSQAQMSIYIVDRFDPSGAGGNSYSSGQIGNVWGNWFGDAFQSLVWDSTSDASNNPASGSMKVTVNFNGQGSIPNQFEVYDGFNGITPALNGLQYTNFQCDFRFAKGSATINNTFGYLQFGIAVGFDQDYFGGVNVPSSNTNWVHVSINLDATADANLQDINDVLFHIYGPSMSGVSIFWVDNIQFTGPPTATNGKCTVDWKDVHQRIDGFGASSAWMSGSLSTSDADLLFSTNNGAGLSLLRTRIAPDGTSWETSIAQQAQARGARIWSTPWSPPAIYKDTNSVNGGHFVSSVGNYQGYAAQLANYVATMKNTYGISLYGVSVQNEPDYSTDYESCLWTSQQIHDFVPYLSTALSNNNVASTKIMLPEDANWKWDLAATAMNDTVTSNLVGVLAAHSYGGSAAPVTQFGTPCPKPLWETEHYFGADDSIANGVALAEEIHSFMTVAQANAYHYWWLEGSGTSSLVGDDWTTPAKRIFVMGNFSRFVRPNFYRIGVKTNSTATSISAYKDSASPNFAIVAINPTTNPINQTFTLTNFPAASMVTPWMTTSDLSLAGQTAVAVTNWTFSYALPAMSIVTFAGQATNRPPVLAAVSGKIINAGATLVLTNSATDPESPPQTLTFSFLSAPTNAGLNSSSGVFTWRPLVSQANMTNPVSVKVTDNGTPGMSATNNFNVTVNPLTQPAFNSITVSNRQTILVANGMFGPDYTLLASTDLVTWRALFTTNSPGMPVTLVDTNAVTNGMGFYRIKLGP